MAFSYLYTPTYRKQRKNEKLLALKKLVVDEDDWAKLSTFQRRKQYSNKLKDKNTIYKPKSRPGTGLISGIKLRCSLVLVTFSDIIFLLSK